MNSIEQNLLNQKISLLKHDIQDIIDKCSKEIYTHILDNLQLKKQEYITELEDAMKELKIVKDKNKLHQEYKKASRTVESLEYHRIKKKSNSNELMSELKHKREQAQEDFENMREIEEEYNTKEKELSINIPGFLFFFKDIVDMYGRCPHIKITDDIYQKRLDWLNSQSDKGALYFTIYDKIVNKIQYNILLEDKRKLEEYFLNLHQDYLTDSQYELFQNIQNNIIEYTNSSIKTKKLKDKFKIIVNNLSNLVVETGLNINEYIKEYHGLYIPLNINIKNESNNVLINGEFISTLYDDKVLEYKSILEELDISHKFITNSTNNLKQELYQYLYKEKTTVKKIVTIQPGKFYKKWSSLTDDEKVDRYDCFAEFFINKYLVEPNLVTHDKVDECICILKTLIKDNFKRIKFKDIKWNTKRGIIEQIFCLKYDIEKLEFYITDEKVKTDKPENAASSSEKPKKISSVRTIVNKNSEKIINEELVIFMIQAKKNKKLKQDDIKTLKDNFIEKLKEKLHLKRVTVNDKIQIFKKFDDIYSVIINNDSNSSIH